MNDTAIFDLNGNYTVTYANSFANRALLVGNDQVTFDLNGNTYSLTSVASETDPTSVVVGQLSGDNAQLALSGGTLSSVEAIVGVGPGANGTVTVNSGSNWNSSSFVLVGAAGNGVLNLAGGNATNTTGFVGYEPGATGTVSVEAGSIWNMSGQLQVGRGVEDVPGGATGTLTISNGGQVTNNGVSFVGLLGESQGTVEVSGFGSTWTSNTELIIGVEGTGSVTISDGAFASNSGETSLADFAGATGSFTITGGGTQWINAESTYVGFAGTGTMEISDGAQSINLDTLVGVLSGSSGTLTINSGAMHTDFGTGFVAYVPGSSGSVHVDGPGSMWTLSGQLQVGRGITEEPTGGATGSLLISNGAHVSNDGTAWIGLLGTSNGQVTVTGPGSTWTIGSFMIIGNLATGSVTISDGASASHVEQLHIGRGVGGPSGDGSLTIDSGGQLTSSASAFVGIFEGATGSVTVTGSGSHWNIAGFGINVGYESQSNGEMTISDGATVSTGAILVGRFPGANGQFTVTGTGSTLDISGYALIGGNVTGEGAIELGGDGVLNVNDGASVVLAPGSDGVFILQTSRLAGNGTVVGEVFSDGTVAPGAAAVPGLVGDYNDDGFVDAADYVVWRKDPTAFGNEQGYTDWRANFGMSGGGGGGSSTGTLTIDGDYEQFDIATLEIEIGGTAQGSQYDLLAVTGTATLDGVLDVSLVNGFTPSAGQEFTVLTAGSIVDDGLTLGGPAAGMFNLIVGATSVVLQANGGSLTAVPEPSSMAMLMLAMVGWLGSRRFGRRR